MSDETDDSMTGVFDLDRRSALQHLALIGGAGLFGATGSAASRETPDSLSAIDADLSERVDQATQRRQDVAAELIEAVAADGQLNERNNDEEIRWEDETGGLIQPPDSFPFTYSKAASGGQSGRTYLTDSAAELSDDGDMTLKPTSGSRPFVSPNSAVSFATDGTDPWLGVMPPAPEATGDRTKAELMEVYAMCQFRDIPFEEYDQFLLDDVTFQDERAEIASAFFADLNKLDYGSALDEWLRVPGDDRAGKMAFRDRFAGCEVGPFVSQHLLREVPIGGFTLDPLIEPFDDDDAPYGTTRRELDAILNGETGGAEPGQENEPAPDTGEPKYVSTGGDLATMVREDPAFQQYLLGGLQLFGWGAQYDGVPFEEDDERVPYVDGGAVAMLDLLGRVCRNGLLSAFHHKWAVHRRLRPETYGARINDLATKAGNDDFPFSNQIQEDLGDLQSSSEADEGVSLPYLGDAEDGLLPLAYPEGSPTHPAYPSGHSVIAGACATVLKAFFADEPLDRLPNFDGAVKATPDGQSLESVDGSDLTVHGEINKLASNIGLGRIFAGVHYRTDHVYGMLLGEQIATATLYDHFRSGGGETNDVGTFAVDGESLSFTTLLGGQEVEANPETFRELRQAAADRSGLRP